MTSVAFKILFILVEFIFAILVSKFFGLSVMGEFVFHYAIIRLSIELIASPIYEKYLRSDFICLRYLKLCIRYRLLIYLFCILALGVGHELSLVGIIITGILLRVYFGFIRGNNRVPLFYLLDVGRQAILCSVFAILYYNNEKSDDALYLAVFISSVLMLESALRFDIAISETREIEADSAKAFIVRQVFVVSAPHILIVTLGFFIELSEIAIFRYSILVGGLITLLNTAYISQYFPAFRKIYADGRAKAFWFFYRRILIVTFLFSLCWFLFIIFFYGWLDKVPNFKTNLINYEIISSIAFLQMIIYLCGPSRVCVTLINMVSRENIVSALVMVAHLFYIITFSGNIISIAIVGAILRLLGQVACLIILIREYYKKVKVEC